MKSALEMLRVLETTLKKVDVGNMLPQSYNMLVFSGMGGSGIVGEIMKSYLIKNGFNKPVFSIKGYELLPFVDKDALVVCISYSGDTEETISVFEQAIKVGAKIISISSGGKLEELSNKHGVPHIKIPTGYPPRYALGFMLNACLWLFGKEEEILDLKEDLKASSSRYEEISKDIAKSLFGYVPIIYGTPLMEAAAYRFKTQINENSKTPAYNAYIPEMHHNEVVGYTNPDINQYLRFVIVADKKEHPRVSLRVNMTIDILKDKGFNPILISEEGNSYISRLLKNIYIGDFASYHLANMYGYDPLPVDIITYVKRGFKMDRIRFAESPFEGHPDKLADIISDEILDEFMRKDPFSRVSINVLLSSNIVFIAGEVSSSAYVDLQIVSKKAIKEVGYTKPEYGFDGDLIGVISSINEQSPEIALCIASEGAGDSAIVVGYATDETESFLPAPIYFAHKISKTTSDFRKKGIMPFLRPDGKTIVGIKYENQNKFYIDSINMFVQHDPDISLNHLRELIFEDIIKKHIPNELLRKETKIKINPAGRFIIGGPVADTGMTGRKIVSDAYGDISFSGGSAFSGKDPTKTDRAASYMARYIAKHIVAAGWAKKILVQIAYAFGVKEPIGFDIETFGTETKPIDLIKSRIREVFSLYPKDIIETLDLRKPIYKRTSCYGHFGKEGLPWEKLDKLEYFS